MNYEAYYKAAHVWDNRAEAAEAAGHAEAVAHCKKMAAGCRSDAQAARRARREALEKLPLTKEEKERWARMMHETWATIAADIEEGMQYCPGQKMTRAFIVEVTCDANRLEQYGGMTPEEAEFFSVIYHRPSGQRWLRSEMNY